MKIKTSELTGIALDYAVALAENHAMRVCTLRTGQKTVEVYDIDSECYDSFEPSRWYFDGMPIVERECINLTCCYDRTTWFADIDQPDTADMLQKGNTLLIAAMRCYVASKLGETVEIPNELLK